MKLSLVIAVLALLGLGCGHGKGAQRERVYRSKPVCEGALRRDRFEIYRAGFSTEMSMNEIEALQELEMQYLEFAATELDYPDDNTEGEVQAYTASLRRKKDALEKLEETYSLYAGSENVDVVLMAHYRIGEAYELFAVDIENTRVPIGYKEAQKQEFCAQLFQKTAGLRDRSRRGYEACMAKAREAGAASNWSKQCQSKLDAAR